jgi:hypothetical protein
MIIVGSNSNPNRRRRASTGNFGAVAGSPGPSARRGSAAKWGQGWTGRQPAAEYQVASSTSQGSGRLRETPSWRTAHRCRLPSPTTSTRSDITTVLHPASSSGRNMEHLRYFRQTDFNNEAHPARTRRGGPFIRGRSWSNPGPFGDGQMSSSASAGRGLQLPWRLCISSYRTAMTAFWSRSTRTLM